MKMSRTNNSKRPSRSDEDLARLRTTATAIVVSATDGNVRAFSGGDMIVKIDPDYFWDNRNQENKWCWLNNK